MDDDTPMRTPTNWIETASGRQVWPTDPRSEDIDIRDIAHSQANLCRFTGHTRKFYSVAQHSVRVMLAVERRRNANCSLRQEGVHCPECCIEKLWALLHDAEEAYINDLSTPVKRLPELSGYKAVARGLRTFIAEHFGLLSEEPEIVREADQWLLCVEAEELMRPLSAEGSIQKRRINPPVGIVKSERPHGPTRAYYRFLYHFWRILGEKQGKKGLTLYVYAISNVFSRSSVRNEFRRG